MGLIHYIFKSYGITVRAGKKHQCPICQNHRKTFSVKKDGRLAKCFKCGHYFAQTKYGVHDSTFKSAA